MLFKAIAKILLLMYSILDRQYVCSIELLLLYFKVTNYSNINQLFIVICVNVNNLTYVMTYCSFDSLSDQLNDFPLNKYLCYRLCYCFRLSDNL